MAPKVTSLATQLSRLVVEALVQIGLTEKDVLGGAIEHTELPWQITPLIVEEILFDIPLSAYIDRPTTVIVDQLVLMYSDAMYLLRQHPKKVLTLDGYRTMGAAVPQSRANERQLLFSLPDGFPDGDVSDYAGVTLSLECAHLLQVNAKVANFVSDESNYYVELPDGMLIGVKDGLPTLNYEEWDFSVEGMVQELLRTPRGAVYEGCDYNVTSKVRSVTTTYKKAIRDWDAVDWAIQTLRVIDGEAALLSQVKQINRVAYERSNRLETLHEAVKVSRLAAITDRQRLQTLKAMLVPEILTPSEFSKHLYNMYMLPPPILAAKVLERIQSKLDEMLAEEERLYAMAVPSSRFSS